MDHQHVLYLMCIIVKFTSTHQVWSDCHLSLTAGVVGTYVNTSLSATRHLHGALLWSNKSYHSLACIVIIALCIYLSKGTVCIMVTSTGKISELEIFLPVPHQGPISKRIVLCTCIITAVMQLHLAAHWSSWYCHISLSLQNLWNGHYATKENSLSIFIIKSIELFEGHSFIVAKETCLVSGQQLQCAWQLHCPQNLYDDMFKLNNLLFIFLSANQRYF